MYSAVQRGYLASLVINYKIWPASLYLWCDVIGHVAEPEAADALVLWRV